MTRDQRADRAVLRTQIAFVVMVAIGFVVLFWATSASVSDEEIRVPVSTAARGTR